MLLLLPLVAAHADELHKLIGYKCDADLNVLVLSYAAGYNEVGEEMIKNKSLFQWDPWSLLVTDERDTHMFVIETKTAKGQCKLKDGLYEIAIGPVPGNHNLESRCGSYMSVWAEVRRGEKIILPPYQFDPPCFDDGPITSEIVIKSGSDKPETKKLSPTEFYQ
jgi:hypothetical protein